MKLTDNFSVFNLFLDRSITIIVDDRYSFNIIPPSLKELKTNLDVSRAYYLWRSTDQQRKILPKAASGFVFLYAVIFTFGMYQEVKTLRTSLIKALETIIPGIKIDGVKKVFILPTDNNAQLTMTAEI